MKKNMNHLKFLSLLFLAMMMISAMNVYSAVEISIVKGGIEQERHIGSFNSIKSSSSIDIFIKQGSTQSVKVVGSEGLIDKVITEVNSSTLNIYTDDMRRSTGDLAVYITMPELKSLKLTGSGDVKSENTISCKDMDFMVTGSGDLSIDLNATNVDGEITGSGDVKVRGIMGVFKIQISGSGDLNAVDLMLEECMVRQSGSGDIRMEGSCKNLNITGSSSGDVSAAKLETNSCRIFKTGSGDVGIWVKDDLYVKSTGSGDIYYKGDPHINSSITGSGEIRKY